MFTIKPLPQQIDRRVVEKMARAEPATIGHFLHSNFMDPALRAVLPEARIAGTAVTLRIPALDGTVMGYALGQVRPGDVLVVDRCGDMRHACFGGVVAYATMKAGAAGVIIDGMATDFAEIRRYGVPVWCRGPSAITTKRIGLAGDFCTPVSCGGVAVRPGDAIIADEMGIVVLAPEQAEQVADRAIAMQEAEKGTLKRLDAGEKLSDINGAAKIVAEALARQG